MKPIKLSPAFKDYLWGGTKLRTDFNKKCDFDKIAESWELSTHKDGQSIVATGNMSGLKLSEYLEKTGEAALGEKAAKFDFFPILIKLIDAKENLSVQVHPGDEYALRVEGEYGKTEMWYIVDCEEGASLYYGFNREITPEEFAERIKNNTVLEVLNKVSVKPGDLFFIEAGTVHAIGEGIVICEIQQNSNTTYRVYDYDRRDKDGKPRQLHIERAIEVANLKKAPEISPKKRIDGETVLLAECKYFTAFKMDISGEKEIAVNKESFNSLIILNGSGEIKSGGESMKIEKGDSIFVPADTGKYTLCGNIEVILSKV